MPRHDQVVLATREMQRDAHAKVDSKEPRGWSKEFKGGCDIRVHFAGEEQGRLQDVSIVNVMQPKYVEKAKDEYLHAASAVEKDKSNFYKEKQVKRLIEPDMRIFGLIIESGGAMSKNFQSLINKCALSCGDEPPRITTWAAATFKTHWKQRLSCTFWRWMARGVIQLVDHVNNAESR